MDEAFLLRARRLLDERQATRLDHVRLVADVTERQGRTPTAAASARLRTPKVNAASGGDAVTCLMLGEPAWREAVLKQGGCFNRAGARRRVNTP